MPPCCVAAVAAQACVELLKPTGGKVHAFVTGLPNAGSRALKMRDGNATLAEKEKQMGLLPQDNTYLTLAAQAADFNVSPPCVERSAAASVDSMLQSPDHSLVPEVSSGQLQGLRVAASWQARGSKPQCAE